MDVEVTKIVNENLSMSEGQDAEEAVTGVTPDGAKKEKRTEV
jgi:hypothetical protein